jgi:hypothetical protein
MFFYESSKNAGFLAKYFESIASNTPFLLFFLLNYGNNYWMSCLYNTIDRIANYIDSLKGGRLSKINEAYEWFIKGWAGATKSYPNLAAKKPIRKRYIIIPDQEDEWSCGMRVMDWTFKLFYFSNNILMITSDSIPDDCHGQRHPRCSAPLPILSEKENTLVLYFRTRSLGSYIKRAHYYKVQS